MGRHALWESLGLPVLAHSCLCTTAWHKRKRKKGATKKSARCTSPFVDALVPQSKDFRNTVLEFFQAHLAKGGVLKAHLVPSEALLADIQINHDLEVQPVLMVKRLKKLKSSFLHSISYPFVFFLVVMSIFLKPYRTHHRPLYAYYLHLHVRGLLLNRKVNLFYSVRTFPPVNGFYFVGFSRVKTTVVVRMERPASFKPHSPCTPTIASHSEKKPQAKGAGE